jgi:hypothetical protein
MAAPCSDDWGISLLKHDAPEVSLLGRCHDEDDDDGRDPVRKQQHRP